MGLKFAIKKAIVSARFKQKKKKIPFDEVRLERYELSKDSGPLINNSYFFGGYAQSTGECLVMRVGKRNLPEGEAFVLYRNDGKFLVTMEDYYPSDNLPIQVKCLEPAKKWQVSFEGTLYEQDTKIPHAVKLEFLWEARQVIFDFFYSYQNPYVIEAAARAKWDENFRKNNAGADDQLHYEQAGFIHGYIEIDGVRKPLELASGRDHAFGTRVWDDMSDHIWLYAFTEKGEVFNYCLVDYPVLKNIHCGYTDIGRDKIVTMDKVYPVDFSYCDGKGPDRMRVKMLMSDGKTLDVQCTRDNYHETHYDGGVFYFQEGVGQFLIDGVKAYGSIEFGFHRDSSRWEKNREYKDGKLIG